MFDFRNRQKSQNGTVMKSVGIVPCEMIAENKKPIWTDNSTPTFIKWSVDNSDSVIYVYLVPSGTVSMD